MDTSSAEMKRALLRQFTLVVIEQVWVDITPDGAVAARYKPEHPCIRASIEQERGHHPKFVLATTCAAVVYLNGDVYKVAGPAKFVEKDIIGDWTNLIVGWGD